MRRGEIRWYTFAVPAKRRRALLLTCNEITGVPATRTIIQGFAGKDTS